LVFQGSFAAACMRIAKTIKKMEGNEKQKD
jgi:hypothetical protein